MYYIGWPVWFADGPLSGKFWYSSMYFLSILYSCTFYAFVFFCFVCLLVWFVCLSQRNNSHPGACLCSVYMLISIIFKNNKLQISDSNGCQYHTKSPPGKCPCWGGWCQKEEMPELVVDEIVVTTLWQKM